MLTAAVFPDFGPDDLARAASIALRSSEDPSPQVFIDLFGLCVEHLAKVRERGVTEYGVVYRLLNGTFDGKPIPEDKQLGMLGILMLGRLDTTRGAIGNSAPTWPGCRSRLPSTSCSSRSGTSGWRQARRSSGCQATPMP